jgi:hypothetical protein
MRKKTGRSELARKAHFLKAGPTEKTGRDAAKARRQKDRLEERESIKQPPREDSPEE